MKLKHIAILATLMVAGQAFALTAYEKSHGCNHEVGDCPDQGGGGGTSGIASGSGGWGGYAGGGSGGGANGGDQYGKATYSNAFIVDGELWEGFSDNDGFFYIATDLTTGKKNLYQYHNSAPLIKAPPPNSEMSRSKLVHGPFSPSISGDEAKQKAQAAAAAKAKFEAGLQAAKAANQNVAAADATALKAPVGVAGSGKIGAAAPMAIVQPAGGMSVGASSPRTKP